MIKKTSTRKSTPIQDIEDIQTTPPPKTGATRIPPMTIGLVAVIIVAALALGIKEYFFTPKTAPQQASETAQQPMPKTTLADVQALVAKVATHIEVNAGEDPTVATIQNADLLRAQNPMFYKDAHNGDRLLIWSDKAVLYSPTLDKILAILPITLPQNAGSATTTAATSATTTSADISHVTIEVRNGSGTVGLGKSIASKLKAVGFNTLPATEAKSKTPYTTSFIIAGPKATEAAINRLQQATGAQVTALPAVEGPMKGDILLIVGADINFANK